MDRKHCQDHTHLMPKVKKIEEEGTISGQLALALIGLGCAAVLYGLMAYDILVAN